MRSFLALTSDVNETHQYFKGKTACLITHYRSNIHRKAENVNAYAILNIRSVVK